VRLMVNKLGDNQDKGQIDFAGRKWHYDTRYFDTQFQSMKRIEVRVYPGDAGTKSNPIAQSTGFMGASIGIPGGSNVDWTVGTTAASSVACGNGTSTGGVGTGGVGTSGSGTALGGSVVSGANQQLGAAQSPNCVPSSSTPATTTTTPTSTTSPQGQTSP